MGYEEVIPPEPTREEQIQSLERLQEDWKNQSYLQIGHMNHHHRQSHMKLQQENSLYNKQFIYHALIGGLFGAILFSGKFDRIFATTNSGVPAYYNPKFIIKRRNFYNHFTKQTIRKYKFGAYIVFASAFAALTCPPIPCDRQITRINEAVKPIM